MKDSIKNIEKKIAVVGCKYTTRDFILGLESHGYPIDHCITIIPDKSKQQRISGYYDLRKLLKSKSIP